MESLAQPAYLISRIVNLSSLALVAYLSGRLVIRHGVRVNYTRKINHFALFFLPPFLEDIFVFESTAFTSVASAAVYGLFLASLTKPVRSRSAFSATMFASIDRPEDRPHTLFWLTTQMAAGFLVLGPLAWVFYRHGAYRLIYIPILINGIGDGLAEPVGVRFGRRTYRVPSLTSGRSYSRSFVGSACVFASALVIVFLFRDAFTGTQFVAAMAMIPVVMTLAEAFAPHTWDTPVLFLAGGVVLLGVIAFL